MLKTLREVLMDAVHVSFDFFKVLIPISIAMKILAELDWIRYLALPLEPVMQLTGLPADLGIAWATGIMVNFYSALIVFIGLLPGLPPLTTEQVTTLAVMMLIAHSIPAEGRIAAQCGVSFIGQAVIRLVVAVIGGVIVHTSCQAFGWLDTPARIVFTPSPDVNLFWWALGEVRNLVSIFCVIFFVMLLQRFLRYLKDASLDCSVCHHLRADGTFDALPSTKDCAVCHSQMLGKSEAERVFFNEYVKKGKEVDWKVYQKQPDNVFFSHAVHSLATCNNCHEFSERELCSTCHLDMASSKKPPVFRENRISGYSQNTMKMWQCEACHANPNHLGSTNASNACFVCHK